MMVAAAQRVGPVYLHFTRDAVPVIYNEDAEFVIGKGQALIRGRQYLFDRHLRYSCYCAAGTLSSRVSGH